MSEQWIGVIIGGAIGFISASIVALINGYFNRSNLKTQLKHQEEREKNILVLSKLEEAHQLISKMFNLSVKFTTEIMLLTQSENKFENLKIYKDSFQELMLPFEKICSNLRIYAPEIETSIPKVTNSINDLHRSTANLLNDLNELPKIQLQHKIFLDSCIELQNEIEKATLKYMNLSLAKKQLSTKQENKTHEKF